MIQHELLLFIEVIGVNSLRFLCGPINFGGMASTGSPGTEWRYLKELSVAPLTVSPLDKVGRPKAGSEHRGETRSTRSFTAGRNNGIRFRESFNCCRAPRSEIAEQPEGCRVLPVPPGCVLRYPSDHALQAGRCSSE